MEGQVDFKFCTNKLTVIGVSVFEGQQLTGVEETPDKFREGGLLKCLSNLGWEVKDLGDITKESLEKEIHALENDKSRKYTYDLPNIEIIGTVNQKLCDLNHQESKQGRFVLNIGGDHGLASGSITGMLKTYSNLKVIWVDAHGDCNTPETSMSGNYHGMPVAHVLGWITKNQVKGFDWLDIHLKPENLVYIGLRDLDRKEKTLLLNNKIKYYTPYDIEHAGGIKFVMDEAMKYLQIEKEDNNPIHVSWDVDACDPSFIYGTGTKARAGISERESHYILQRIAATGNLVSFDIVEVNPALDIIKEREIFHGDNPIIKGTQSVCNSIDLTLSALGFSWRH